MPRRDSRQDDLFAPPAPAEGAALAREPGNHPWPPEGMEERDLAWALEKITRDLLEVEQAQTLPMAHDTSRAMGRQLSFKGRLWQVPPEIARDYAARWDAAWERLWAQWEEEELRKAG